MCYTWMKTVNRFDQGVCALMCTYFKLQRCVAATGRQWGHRGVHKAIEQQWATGVVEQRKEGILWEGWCDGRQWAEQVVRGCLCLCYVLGTTLLKRCSQFYYFKHEIEKKKTGKLLKWFGRHEILFLHLECFTYYWTRLLYTVCSYTSLQVEFNLN